MMIDKARQLATLLHKDQLRKYTGEPYINHPIEVARLVSTVPHTDEMICAAILHDTSEDCGITIKELAHIFGNEVAMLVEMLTDPSTKEDGNRRERKSIDLMHTSKASPQAKTLKLADLIDNTKSIVEHDKSFARIYLTEKESLLEVLTEGDPFLYGMAKQSLIWGQSQLIQHRLSRRI